MKFASLSPNSYVFATTRDVPARKLLRMRLPMPRWIRISAVAFCALLVLPAVSAGQSGNESRRDDWQRVADIVAALGAAAGSHVADVGAGDGYFTTRLSKA